jgi:hypothetical protein
MAFGPFASEQVYDPQFEELVEKIARHPDCFVIPANFSTVCAFIDGFDMARSSGPLMGLKPWLVMRVGDGNNLHWTGLAKRICSTMLLGDGSPDEESSIRELGKLLSEFLEYRRSNGLAKIFRDYSRWLLRRSWYTGPLREK